MSAANFSPHWRAERVSSDQTAAMRFATTGSTLYLVTDDTPGARTGIAVSDDVVAAFDAWDATLARAAELVAAGTARVALADGDLSAPSPRPRQVFGIGLNYRAHADETGQAHPEAPNVFTKWVSCLTGPYAEVELPSPTVDYECELVAVIGRTARRVPRDDAWNFVAGLCVGQDVSERIVQRTAPANQFSCGKSFNTFGPMGPTLVTVDELRGIGLDPDDLALECQIDGETMQSSRTGDMIFGVGALIEYLSRIVTLFPGDVIFTGTPSGVGVARTPQRWLAPGEELVSSIDGLGTMRNRCVAAEFAFR
jgi:2-keto-4-pentenoate hydratase/2-oxohepta-3-ene-1,7-dioic acid hydratase in catechol pathway